jgi:hypothetical protein
MTDRTPLRTPERPWTRGPWTWAGSRLHYYYLATAHSGRYHVMGFKRKGPQNAQPVFLQMGQDKDSLEGPTRLVPADDLCIFEVCREATDHKDPRVYRTDIVGFRNPDAQLIAAAPELAEALIECLQYVTKRAYVDHTYQGVVDRARAALEKAGAKL